MNILFQNYDEIAGLYLLYRNGFLLILALIIFLIFLINSNLLVKFIDKRFTSKADWLVKEFDALFVEIKRSTALIIIYAGTFGVGFIIFIMFLPNWIAGLIIGSGFGYMFSFFIIPIIKMKKAKRASIFNLQMVDALSLMSNGLRSGLNLNQAVELVVNEMKDPIKQEFNLLLSQNRVGVPIDEGFVNLSKRLEIEDLDMFATAILILRETGGNLPETFDTIVYTIRERVKLSAKIKALTAQGVMQSIVISVIPIILLIIMYFAKPETVGLMFSTPLGLAMLFVMFFLQGLGGLIIKKIVSIKV